MALPWTLLLLWVLAVPAMSQSAPTSITLTPDSDNVRATIIIDGTGFDRTGHEQQGSPVTFRFEHPDPAEHAQDLTVRNLRWLDASSFTGTFVVPDVPADPSVNGYLVIASQFGGELQARANFVILPTLNITPTRGPGGAEFELSGTGWEPDEPMVFRLRRVDGGALPAPYSTLQNLTPTAGPTFLPADPEPSGGPSTGSGFTARFTIPRVPAQDYLVEASQFRRKLIQQVPLQVITTLDLAPAAGPAGSAVVATATGFDRPEAMDSRTGDGNETIVVLFDGETVTTFATGGSLWTGDTTFAVPFDVPTRPPGRYRVIVCQRAPPTATDCATNRIVASATFTVSPVSLFVDPASGIGGSTTTLSGGGWNRNQDLTLSFDGDVVATIAAGSDAFSATGAFEVDLTIPDVVADRYAIRACQSCGTPNEVAATVIFTVLPSLKVAPALGAPGDEVTATGTGWRDDVQARLFVGAIEVAVLPAGSSSFFGATSLRQNFATPSLPAGLYEVRACQRCGTSREVAATAPLRIIPAISLNPPLGPPGFVTSVRGDGFPAGATVILEWDRGNGTVEVVAGTDGRFNVPFLIMYNDGHGPRLARATLPGNALLPPEQANPEPTADFLVVQGSAQPNDFQDRR